MKRWRLDEIRDLTSEELNEQSDELVERIKPILARRHPGVQGVVIADLLAIWLAGQPPSTTEALIANHIQAARNLVPLYRERMGTASDADFH